MDNYKTEVCERWGNTDAYREHEQKTKKRAADESAAFINNKFQLPLFRLV